MEILSTQKPQIDGELGALAAVMALEGPAAKALSPAERLRNATLVHGLAEQGIPIDVAAIHPAAVGIETITAVRAVLRGRGDAL